MFFDINLILLELAVTDIELVELLKNGNHDALESIYKRYHMVLYSHAYRRLPDREDVRDILHEIFINLWQNRDKLVITSSLSAYLYASVRSRVLNVIRNQKVRDNYVQSLQLYMEEGQEIIEAQLREKELIKLVEQEVGLLPPQMRTIFEMSRFQELSHKEVAEELNISPQTVRTQVRNALRILRVKLGDNIFTLFF